MFFKSKMISELKALGYPIDNSSKKTINIYSNIYKNSGDNPKEAAIKFFYTSLKKVGEDGVRVHHKNIEGAKSTIDGWVKKRQIRPQISVIFMQMVCANTK